MTTSLSLTSPLFSAFSPRKILFSLKLNRPSITQSTQSLHFSSPFVNVPHFNCFDPVSSTSRIIRTVPRSSSKGFLEDDEIIPSFEEKPVKVLLLVLFWASLSLAWFAASGDAKAAVDSIRASKFGLKIASALQNSGWPAEAVVVALATLPVIELRGAIPVGYWMQLKPVALTVLSVLGNMVPVPFIILYLKKFATLLAGRNASASQFLDILFKRAKEKAAPVEEFQWLGLMLFVAVPFPGTGAWTGAIIASILDMPFWSGVSANFFGVVVAGLLVNLLVNLGLKEAIVTGVILFIISTFMWSILRMIKKSFEKMN